MLSGWSPSLPLARGSSPVDWCEANYAISPLIAEFGNTITNVLFVVMPPLLIKLHRPYARLMGPGIYVILSFVVVVGISSAYFHATLSLVGQLLDEIAILWLVMGGLTLWLPQGDMWPVQLRKQSDRRAFTSLMGLVTLFSTMLGFVEPRLNAFMLMTLGIPLLSLLIRYLRRETRHRVISLGRRTVVVAVLALICWLNDKLLCDMWSRIGFTFLHGVWHIFAAITAYTAIVLFAYFHAVDQWWFDGTDCNINDRRPQSTVQPLYAKKRREASVALSRVEATPPAATRPAIGYWPIDSFELGIPYVKMSDDRVS